MKVRAAPISAVPLIFCVVLSMDGAADDALLEIGKPVSRNLSGFETQSHAIAMREGQFAAVALRHGGIDFTARLAGPDGKISDEFEVPRRAGDAANAEFVAGTSGVHHVLIRAPYREAPGRYEISLIEVRAATGHDRRMQESLSLASEASGLVHAGNDREALPLATRALEISQKELGARHATVGLRLAALGGIYSRTGAFDKAELLLRQAWEIDREILGEEHPRTLELLLLMGNNYSVSGDYGKAEPLLNRAYDVTGKTLGPEHPALVDCLRHLANLDFYRGDFAREEERLKRALTIADRTLAPDDPLTLHVLNNLAVLYNNRREYVRAEPMLQRVVNSAPKAAGPESEELALALWNLALIAQERDKDNGRALDLYQRAEAILEKDKGAGYWELAAVLNNIANIYKSKGDYGKALDLHLRVHEMREKSLGAYDSATVLSLGNIARTYASMGDASNAVKFQMQTDEALEKNLALNLASGSERQKLAYFDSVAERTDRTISLQVRLAPDSKAAVRLAALAALQRKGRVLDAMSLNLTSLRERMDSGSQALLDAWNTATSHYARVALRGRGPLAPADYQKRLAELAAERERTEAEVSRRSAEFVAQSKPVTLEAVQALIPGDAALVEFASWRPFDPKLSNGEAYGERRYIAYVLRTSGEVKWKELGPAKEVDLAVERFRRALADPESKTVRETARALDRKVMEPVRALVGGATQLLVSPEGPLNLAPLDALVDEQGHYLIERYLISYLSSGRDLLRMQTPRASHSGPVIIADPSFDGPGKDGAKEPALQLAAAEAPRRSVTIGADLKDLYFAPLAGAAQEASAIASLFPDARVLRGHQATEQALKQVDAPNILHIATHGFFLPATPGAGAGNSLLRSGLALAGANQRSGGNDDGIFTALEASGLNLWGTRLVTLSACDTGLGEVRNAEGVFGLRRAFVLAGAETLVMSLWPVSDYVTRQTMTAFYGGLKQGLGRGEALRQAQLAILKSKGREHPFYWASFIESGEWASLDRRR
jgi:CHAT domain-containing protein